MHCPALLLPCLSVCYRNEMDLDQVPSLWWNNLCRGVARSEPGGVDQYSSYCSVFQASSFKLKAVFRYTIAVSNTSRSLPRGGGGYSNYFLTGCAARGLKPLPISKDFSPSKNGWFKAFFRNFRKSGPISKGFSTSKWLILRFFSRFLRNGTLF